MSTIENQLNFKAFVIIPKVKFMLFDPSEVQKPFV
jgi:hypothetical protein